MARQCYTKTPIPEVVIDLASKYLQDLIWKRGQALLLDHGGFDWEQYLKHNQRAESDIIQLRKWLREVQCAL